MSDLAKGAVLVTEESLAEAMLDPRWQVAFHRWMTVGWSNTKNDEALPLAAALLTKVRPLAEVALGVSTVGTAIDAIQAEDAKSSLDAHRVALALRDMFGWAVSSADYRDWSLAATGFIRSYEKSL